MDKLAKLCIFLYPRAKKVKKCVNEHQYYGNVVLLWLVLLCTGTFLITLILFILQVIMHPVLYIRFGRVFVLGSGLCTSRTMRNMPIPIGGGERNEQERLHGEQDRMQYEQDRLQNEQDRLQDKQHRLQDEQERLLDEQERLSDGEG